MQTFEASVAMLQEHPTAVEFNRHFDEFVGGQVDLQNRVQNLELATIKYGQSLDILNTNLIEVKNILSTLAGDRNDLKKRQDAVEAAPTAHHSRISDLEARIRAVEGAIYALSPHLETPVPAKGSK